MKRKFLTVLASVLAILMMGSALATLLPFVIHAEGENAGVSEHDSYAGTLKYETSEDGKTVTISYDVNGETVSYTVPNNYNYTMGGYAATDDLDRTMYTSADTGSYGSTGEKYVGLFYFLWQGEHGDSGIFDLQKIIDEV